MKQERLQKELDKRNAVRDEGYAEIERMILYMIISFVIIVAAGVYISSI